MILLKDPPVTEIKNHVWMNGDCPSERRMSKKNLKEES